MNELRVEVAGEQLQLHVERSLWWPRKRILMVADVHLGKASVLRKAGVSVPSGQTNMDLARLDALIAHYQPETFVVLGDLVHGKSSLDAPWVDATQLWRRRHRRTAMLLVAGNHDRHFDSRVLGFEVSDDVLTVDGIALSHEPKAHLNLYVLAGHTHPGIAVLDGWRKHRLPAFRFSPGGAVLPAFGTLTGLHVTSAHRNEYIVAVTPAGLLEVSRQALP